MNVVVVVVVVLLIASNYLRSQLQGGWWFEANTCQAVSTFTQHNYTEGCYFSVIIVYMGKFEFKINRSLTLCVFCRI